MDRDGGGKFSASRAFEVGAGDISCGFGSAAEGGREARIVSGFLVTVYFGLGAFTIFRGGFTKRFGDRRNDDFDYSLDFVCIGGAFEIFCGGDGRDIVCGGNVDCNLAA